MRQGRTQAHEKDMHHMFASIGIAIAIGIGIGGYLDADAESDPHTDSDPEISAISVLFSEQSLMRLWRTQAHENVV